MPNKEEIIVAALKGAAAGIPFAGGLIAELGDLFLNPIEKRKENWRNEIIAVLDEINKKYHRSPEEVANDPKFVSALLNATSIAVHNHQEEKILALKNALINVGNPDAVNFDKMYQFLHFVDELSVTHITVLANLEKYSGQFSKIEELGKLYSQFILVSKLEIERLVFRSIIEDLNSRFLIQTGDLEEYPEFASKKDILESSGSKVRPLEITELGKTFLNFIGDFEP
ncbi:hypothetical protein NC796_04820 [Aliifodinibius sp. S!AR15-10]|uniref:hypothetical protein n=1 Tax=Aliifodinibius sp. S!AR15-10 TaxID=2950437 RepID=UPI002867AF7D|nr:hypothetical protein [Aliifodinibius sp. S!AR15-10]MDR8390453.1 hypothetical protein [Aliifodinibius sp. S!AR15-10]